VEEYLDEMKSSISIRSINRDFNIKLHLIKLSNCLTKNLEFGHPNKNPNIIQLEIKAQIYSGNHLINKMFPLTWKGLSNNITALIREDIIYDLKYSDLPLFSNIIFKIRSLIKVPHPKDKKKKCLEKRTIAWANFRLFDHLKRLKTGKIIF
jgi:hypothetical protein